MNTIELKGFIPFPGNYFSYYFDLKKFPFEVGEVLNVNLEGLVLPLSLKVIQKVILDNEVKAQLQTLWNSEFSLKEQIVDRGTKEDFKSLLQAWDSEEFSSSNNFYFCEIDKTNSKKKFSELIGGCLSRPYKFPFSSKEKAAMGIQLRTELLLKSTLDDQLNHMKQIIRTEIK